MTAAELKATADALQPALRQQEFDEIMALCVAEAQLGRYKLLYKGKDIPGVTEKVFFEYNATIKKLEDPPNNLVVKDLTANEGFYLIKW